MKINYDSIWGSLVDRNYFDEAYKRLFENQENLDKLNKLCISTGWDWIYKKTGVSSSLRIELEYYIEALSKLKINLVDKSKDIFVLGLSFAEIGEEGRYFFHKVCTIHQDYSHDSFDKTYSKALKEYDAEKGGLRTFFSKCHAKGITPYRQYIENPTADNTYLLPNNASEQTVAKYLMIKYDLIACKGLVFQYVDNLWKEFEIDDLKTIISKLNLSGLTGKKVDSILEMFLSYANVKINLKEPSCIYFKNGIYNYQTEDFTEYSDKHKHNYIVHTLNTEFNKEATCDNFNSYLDGLFKEDENKDNYVKQLQEFGGIVLDTSIKTNKALFLLGEPGAGKSTFAFILQDVLGGSICSTVMPKEMESKNTLATIEHKYLNISDDVEIKEPIKGKEFHKLVEGLELNIKRHYVNDYAMKPICKMILTANGIPIFKESEGVARRSLTIWYNTPLTNSNPNFRGLLNKELSGIANWLIEGLIRYKKQKGFTSLGPSLSDKYDSSIDAFINEACEISEGSRIKMDKFHKDYIDFCKQNNLVFEDYHNFGSAFTDISKQEFEIETLKFYKKKSGTMHIFNLKLK